MSTMRRSTPRRFRVASNAVLLCAIYAYDAGAPEPRAATIEIGGHSHTRTAHQPTKDRIREDRGRSADLPRRPPQSAHPPDSDARVRDDLKFTHLSTNEGLSQNDVTAIVQDRRGFMWFATREGLNRYDGYTFVVYKHIPNDPGSPSSNFIQDLMEDDKGYLWIATNNGANKFDPATERATRFLHDPNNPNSIGGASVKSIAQDSLGNLWFGTEDGGLDKLDPTTGRFTHYRNDSDGRFVGRITQVIPGRHPRDIWFVGERGLFHLNQDLGHITRQPATRSGFSAASVYEDEIGNLWMLGDSPIDGLVKYERQAERFTRYPVGVGAVGGLASTTMGGSANEVKLAADGQNGLWVPSSLGLYYFDRRTERFTYRFQHDESNADSLDSNTVLSVYQDKNGVLWVATENAGLNILDFGQKQFVRYTHRPGDPNSLSAGRVKAIYQDRDGVLWVGFFPRALNRLDRTTGHITHYLPNTGEENSLGPGTTVESIYKDAAGYLWVASGGNGVARFDERTGRFKQYVPNPDDPNSLVSSHVYTIVGDRKGQMWVGQRGGIGRYDPATDGFTTYRPVPDNPASRTNAAWVIYQDGSGMLWAGTWSGTLIRFDDEAKSFVSYTPDPGDPHRLQGGGIFTIHEDRTGTLWLGTLDGLYRHDRRTGAFTRYTETQGLPSSTIRCIQEDRLGRLWLSTWKGISRFDPQTETFRNYDVADGLQSNEFSNGCYQNAAGEIFFGGTKGFNAFFPDNVRDNPYVPPIAITSFRIFNKPVAIGAQSVLKRAIPYIDALRLSYWDNVFSFEFAALSYINSQKNRYRYKLDNFDPGWSEVDSKQRSATYTNLNPGHYVFRVQGSNSDGVWNEAGCLAAHSDHAALVDDRVVPGVVRGRGPGVFVGGVLAPDAPGAAQIRHDARGPGRRAHAHCPGASRHAASELSRAPSAVPDGGVPATGTPGRGEERNWMALLFTQRRRSPKGAMPCRGCEPRRSNAMISRSRSEPWATHSRLRRAVASRPHLGSQSRARHAICTRSFVTRFTRSRRKPFATPSAMRMPRGSKSRFATTTSSSDCGFATMARGSIRRCSPTRGSRDTMACAACRNVRH